MLILALFAPPAAAQRTTYTNVNAWFMLGAEKTFTPKWSGLLDVQMRRSGPIKQASAVFFRPLVNYAITPAFKVGFGVSRSESFPYGKIPNAYHTPEWRMFEQIQLSQSVGRVGITHRYRVEQRFQGRRGADTSDHSIDTWNRANRFRYQLKGTLPLRGATADPHEAYLTGYDELMVGWGKNVTGNMFDQNRAMLGIGWKFSNAWRTELGFLEQNLLKPTGRDLERNHTFTIGAYWTGGHETHK